MDAQAHAAFAQVLTYLHRIESAIGKIHSEGHKIMGMLDNLAAEVARQTTVDAAVVARLKDLVDQIAALAAQPTVDPAALQALVDQVKANDDTLVTPAP